MSKIKIVIFVASLPLLLLIGYNFYPEKRLAANAQIDKLIVYKSKGEMHAFFKGELLKVYKISIGRTSVGKKEFEGDCKTPEGKYFINGKNPYSGYHKNLGISYPNAEDIKNAKLLGKPTGGDVKIHGLRNGRGVIGKLHRWVNWTYGCIAVTNTEVDELYYAVKIGTPIEINP